MGYVIGGVVTVGAVAVLNLLLTLRMVRTLRTHTERLAARPAGGGIGPPPDLVLPAGERPGGFRTEAVDGTEVSLDSLATPALLGFFSLHCEPCREWVPRFVQAAGELPQGRWQALAVVVGGGAETSEEVAELRRVAQVVVEEAGGPVTGAFAVKGWPVLCRLGEDGTIATTDNHAAVAVPAPA